MPPDPSTDFPDRLITLIDGRSGLRTTLHTEISEPAGAPLPVGLGERSGVRAGEGQGEGGTAVLDFISSDETLDRYHEIISASGWKLANYQRNPVFQNAHQYGDITFTLGKALITEIRSSIPSSSSQLPSSYLFQRIQFATDANPIARIAYSLYKGKFLNAVSVGFVPLRWEPGSEEAGYRRKFVEQELLEVSAVAIPANPSALALALKSGALQKSDLLDLAGLLRQTLGAQNPLPATKERGEGEGEGHSYPTSDFSLQPLDLLKAALQIRDLLRHL